MKVGSLIGNILIFITGIIAIGLVETLIVTFMLFAIVEQNWFTFYGCLIVQLAFCALAAFNMIIMDWYNAASDCAWCSLKDITKYKLVWVKKDDDNSK